MQLGKKSKTTDMFERVRGDLGASVEDSAPLVSNTQTAPTTETVPSGRASLSADRDAIHIVVGEAISAKFDKEGSLKSFSVKGDLQLRISDPSLARVKLDLVANPTHNAQFKTHPNVDKGQFSASKAIQLKDLSKSFPVNTPVGVLRWSATAPADATGVAPITFNVWVNKGSGDEYTFTVEYELSGSDSLRDVVVTIPYSTSEPSITSLDAVYEVSGDTVEWNIGNVEESNSSGSFEFEAQAEDEAEFFPMSVHFTKSRPFVDVDVSSRRDEVGFWANQSSTGELNHFSRHGPASLIQQRYQVCSRRVLHRKGMILTGQIACLEIKNNKSLHDLRILNNGLRLIFIYHSAGQM